MKKQRASRPGWHELLDKDEESRLARCRICGPVDMFKNGDYWVCGNKKRDLRASYYNTHKRPSSPSPHALIWKSVELGIGLCPIDGEVTILPVARGWACGPHAERLKIVRREPAVQCSMCGNFDSRHNRVSPTEGQKTLCEACANLLYNGPQMRQIPDSQRLVEVFESRGSHNPGTNKHDGALGAHFVSNFELMNPDYMPDYESAVPGWKTLGAGTDG